MSLLLNTIKNLCLQLQLNLCPNVVSIDSWLSLRAPAPDVTLKLLKEIAEDFPKTSRQPFQSNKYTPSALSDDDDDDEILSLSESRVLLGLNSMMREDEQFLLFPRPPPQSFPIREVGSSPLFTESDNVDLQDVLAAA